VTLKGGRFVNIRLCYLHILFPVVVETLGAVGTEAISFLHNVGRRIQFVTHHSLSLCSASVWQYNAAMHAACLIGSMPHSARWDELFYI